VELSLSTSAQNEADLKLGEGPTDGIDICTLLDKKPHNLDVAVPRRHVQRSLLVGAYT
jgi:hypothetical protein